MIETYYDVGNDKSEQQGSSYLWVFQGQVGKGDCEGKQKGSAVRWVCRNLLYFIALQIFS